MISKDNIVFTFKKSYHIASNTDYFCCVGNSVVLYDTKSGEMKANFKDMKHPSFSVFTSDNRLIIKTTIGEYYIYDMACKTLVKKLKQPKGVKGSTAHFAVTPDNKYILDSAYIFPNANFMIMDIETGEYILYDLNGARTCKLLCDQAKNEYYIATTYSMPNAENKELYSEFYSFTYPCEQLNLQKISVPMCKDFLHVDYNSEKLAVNSYDNIIYIYDMNTKCEDFLCYEKDGVLYDLKWSKNGKYIVLAQTSNISIFDVQTKKCVNSYDVDYGCFAEFYDNDTKLLIGTWENGCCITLTQQR